VGQARADFATIIDSVEIIGLFFAQGKKKLKRTAVTPFSLSQTHLPVCTSKDLLLENMDSEYSLHQLPSFARKLNHMMSPSGVGSKKIRCMERWGPDGFRIIDTDAFEKHVLPKYFKSVKLTSFKRQLNIYDFARIPDVKNAYRHKDFIVGDYERIQLIVRNKDNRSRRCDASAGEGGGPSTKGKSTPPQLSGKKRPADGNIHSDEEWLCETGFLGGALFGEESECSFKPSEPLRSPEMGLKKAKVAGFKRAKVEIYRLKRTEKSYTEVRAAACRQDKCTNCEPHSAIPVIKVDKTDVPVSIDPLVDESDFLEGGNPSRQVYGTLDHILNSVEQPTSPSNYFPSTPTPTTPNDSFEILPPSHIKKFSFPEPQLVKAENSLSLVELNNGPVTGFGLSRGFDGGLEGWMGSGFDMNLSMKP